MEIHKRTSEPVEIDSSKPRELDTRAPSLAPHVPPPFWKGVAVGLALTALIVALIAGVILAF